MSAIVCIRKVKFAVICFIILLFLFSHLHPLDFSRCACTVLPFSSTEVHWGFQYLLGIILLYFIKMPIGFTLKIGLLCIRFLRVTNSEIELGMYRVYATDFWN